MRLRFALVGAMLAALGAAIVPGTVTAAPQHNRGLTISAAPNPIIAGEGVIIYGRLTGPNSADQTVQLMHRINPHRYFSLIGTTRTDSDGYYRFTRQEGIVYTNRSWFVRGPDGTHSRTVHEKVAALVSIQSNLSTATTGQRVTFTGHVTPNHAFERVVLQAQKGSANRWNTLKSARLGPRSNYSISYRWRVPDERLVRVLFRGDDRNIKGASDALPVTIEQKQVHGFTINSSAPVIGVGQSATISGILSQKASKAPEANTPVTLCYHAIGQSQFTCDTAGVTNSDGSYHFTVTPEFNAIYQVRTTLPPHRHSAQLFEGVRDDVSLTATPTSSQTGQKVTFTGSVTPDKAGDTVYLQRFGADGYWHTVAVSTVQPNSTFQFVREFGNTGSKTFRAHVLADPQNVGGVSNQVTVNVSLGAIPSQPAS
jgi:hypothetical protein